MKKKYQNAVMATTSIILVLFDYFRLTFCAFLLQLLLLLWTQASDTKNFTTHVTQMSFFPLSTSNQKQKKKTTTNE